MPSHSASPSALRPILHIEDDADAVLLTHRVFHKAGVSHPIDVVSDGKSAMEYLTARIAGGAARLPLLILIDLDLPGKNGFDVLEWIAEVSALYLAAQSPEKGKKAVGV